MATTVEDHLCAVGEVFATFDCSNQDSGNISYGVRSGRHRYFIKTAGVPEVPSTHSHAERVSALRNASRLFHSCPHPVLASLRDVLESDTGPLLVYDWADGELLGHAWRDPGSALQRFRRLPVATICGALDRLYGAHRALAQHGWIAVDFYLGSLLANDN